MKLYRTDVQMTVLAAADGCLPFHADVTPGEAQTVTLDDDRQALIFTPRGPEASACFTRSRDISPVSRGAFARTGRPTVASTPTTSPSTQAW